MAGAGGTGKSGSVTSSSAARLQGARTRFLGRLTQSPGGDAQTVFEGLSGAAQVRVLRSVSRAPRLDPRVDIRGVDTRNISGRRTLVENALRREAARVRRPSPAFRSALTRL